MCRYPACITLGDNVSIDENVHITTENSKSYLRIEDNVSIGIGTSVDYTGGIIIRPLAHVASHVYILTHSHGYDYRNKPIGTPLIIGQHAFIGSRACILPGCNYIGDNSVIGVGSIVTKDVPDNTVVAGNPARVLKKIDI